MQTIQSLPVENVVSIALETVQFGAKSRNCTVTYDQVLPEFLIGTENQLLLDALEAEQLSQLAEVSPVVIYGPNGVGKTAVAITLVRRWMRVVDTTKTIQIAAVDFARQFATAIASDDMNRFRENFRTVDTLLVDSLEGIVGKFAAQDELLNTLDTLRELGGLVIVTSVDLPQNLRGIKKALASRLTHGASIPIAFPAANTCQMAVQQLAREAGRRSLKIPVKAYETFTAKIPKNVSMATIRGLFHEFMQANLIEPVKAKKTSTESGETLDDEAMDAAYDARIDQILETRDQQIKPSIAAVARAVAKQSGVPLVELRGQSRKSHLVRARSLAALVCRRKCGKSLAKIGEYFGGRDHTTVLHAIRKTEQQLFSDQSLRRLQDEVLRELNCVN